MTGVLYGVGIGPGDPELLTLKAIHVLEKADVIAFPGDEPANTLAYNIIKEAVKLEGKIMLGLPFPMTKDKELLAQSHREGAEKIAHYLEKGMTAAFPTLGDPSVYSTFTYINTILKDKGFKTQVIPGITSFCAAAAAANEALGETNQQIHIIPLSYDIEEALKLNGTKVLMKSGKQLKNVIEAVRDNGQQMILLENLGMDDERIVVNPDSDIEAGYYTTIIVK